jgi:hypothetical protein
MNSLLIHGCYDSKTLETLKNLGTKELAFDLRGRSSNLIPFRELTSLLKNLSTERIFLTFENDQKETIHSFLNLLKNEPFVFTLIFRDHQSVQFYKNLGLDFYWMFDAEGDWRAILSLPNAKGVLLPIKAQTHYQKLSAMWDLIEEKNLDVYLHADSFEQTLFMNLAQEIKLSLDLTKEIEQSYRNVDQEKLGHMKIWRRLNESFAGQR